MKADRLKEIPVPQNEQQTASDDAFSDVWEEECENPSSKYRDLINSNPDPYWHIAARFWNAALSQPVPQGEQSLPPQLVRPETIRARTLAGTNFIAYEANEADAVFAKLQTELLDTRRALEMRCGYAETQLLLAQARSERMAK